MTRLRGGGDPDRADEERNLGTERGIGALARRLAARIPNPFGPQVHPPPAGDDTDGLTAPDDEDDRVHRMTLRKDTNS